MAKVNTEGHVGPTVRRLRRERRWTQEDLAERAGVDQTTVSLVETAKRDVPLDLMRKLAGGLGVPVGLLLRAAGLLEEAECAEEEPDPELRAIMEYLRQQPDIVAQLKEAGIADDPGAWRDLADLWRPYLAAVVRGRRDDA